MRSLLKPWRHDAGGGDSPHSIRPGFVSTCPAKPPACVRVPEPSRVSRALGSVYKHSKHTLPLSASYSQGPDFTVVSPHVTRTE
eukprot:5101451-Prymnesium_polylepis.1